MFVGEGFFLLTSFVLGAVIGSFLNVCIYRIPAGKSIVSPSSSCPSCGHQIRCYQNIPIISYLILQGRCASCRQPISMRYPIVEALTGGLFALVFHYFGLNVETPVYWLFLAVLVAIFFIDLDHRIIPDVISLPGIVVGFLCSFLLPQVSWLESLLGVLIGGGVLLLIAWGYELLTKREGMGGGDIKLLAMLGAFLGWKAVLPVVFLASLLGTLVGVPLLFLQKSGTRLAIPFGPFLATAAFIYLFWGKRLIDWYFHLVIL